MERYKLRVLFFICGLENGGAEKQLLMLVKNLPAHGIKPYVVTLRAGGYYWEAFKTLPDIELITLGYKGMLDTFVYLKLLGIVKEKNIDIVQGWGVTANPAAAITGWVTGRPAFMGVRFSNLVLKKFRKKVKLVLGRLTSRFAAVIVFNSESGRQLYNENTYPAEKSLVIRNGLEIPSNLKSGTPLSGNGDVQIGMVARLDRNKGHEFMFRTMKILAETDRKHILHLFGKGEKKYVEKLHLIAAGLGIEQYVKWHG